MLQKILVAIGGSPDSEQIFATGLALAEKLDAEILLLHVLDPLVPHGLSTVASPLVGGVLPMLNDVAILLSERLRQRAISSGVERLRTERDRTPSSLCSASQRTSCQSRDSAKLWGLWAANL
jgi:nucleotide-binding universal stress UspA family protein